MSTSSDGPLLVGRYQLEIALGRGSFGQVWRARDVALRRSVAVKLVELTDITDPAVLAETIERFRREAKTIGALRHQNIVTAYDAGRVGSEMFLVMELAEGASLADILVRRSAGGMGRFPVASVLDIAEQVCAGLDAAHAIGVVHRDIKPANLMVATRLRVKIIDFGIARLLADNSPRLTLPSHALGTVLYMSPEQAVVGGDVDGRADLYSLGCVLYEMLAGAPPFSATDPSEVLMMQLSAQAVALDARRADLPTGLSQLVDDLMAKDRAARPAGAQQVIARIGAIRAALGAAGAQSAVPVHEADRATVLKPDEPGRPTGNATGAVGGGRYGDDFAVRPTVTRLPPRFGAAVLPGPVPPAPVVPLVPPAPVVPPVPPTPVGPVGSAVPTGAVPAWPQPPQRRRARRRGLRTVVSTLITAAIVAGAGAYAWARTHQAPLKIVSVVVTVHSTGPQCDVTEDVIGTIFTNGNGGQANFQWVRNGNATSRIEPITIANGQSSAQVQDQWIFSGPGTAHSTDELRVLSPDAVQGHATFTYSCAQ